MAASVAFVVSIKLFTEEPINISTKMGISQLIKAIEMQELIEKRQPN